MNRLEVISSNQIKYRYCKKIIHSILITIQHYTTHIKSFTFNEQYQGL